jgi:hypothetical protein
VPSRPERGSRFYRNLRNFAFPKCLKNPMKWLKLVVKPSGSIEKNQKRHKTTEKYLRTTIVHLETGF